MTRLIVVVACLAAGAVVPEGGHERRPAAGGTRLACSDANSREGLERLLEAWRHSYNAGDAAAVASLYTEDAYYLSAHVAARGRAQIEAYFRRGIEAGGHVDAIRVLARGCSGDLAYTAGTYDATNGGVRVSGRNVVALARVAGTWRIAAHESVVSDQP